MKEYIKKTALGKKIREVELYIHEKKKLYRRWKTRKQDAIAMIEKLRPDMPESERALVIPDMIRARRKGGFGFDEYFLFHFNDINKTDAQRYAFFSDAERCDVCDSMNNPSNKEMFDDKYQAYQKYKKYYHRDLIKFVKGTAEERKELADFVAKHSRFIVKPFNGWCGIGIQIMEIGSRSVDSLADELVKTYQYGCVIEEVMETVEELRKLHPKSLNTLRVPTVRFDDHVEVIHPLLRVGRGDSIVDNAGAGGLICLLDPKTGKIVKVGDETGKLYENHPETGFRLLGYQVPHWEECVAFAQEIAMVTPDNRYTGWDLCLTKDGWIMIEGNCRGQFVWQILNVKGFREEMYEILKKVHVTYKSNSAYRHGQK